MAVDLDKLAELAQSGESSVMVSRGWLRAIVDEIRNNRKEIASLRKKLAERPVERTVERSSKDFPHEDFDRTMGFFDKTMESMAQMFGKLR